MQIYVQLCCDLLIGSNNCDMIVMLQDLLTLQMAKSRRDLRFDDRVQVHRKGHPGRESQEPLAHELRCMPNTEQVQFCQVIKKRCHRYRPTSRILQEETHYRAPVHLAVCVPDYLSQQDTAASRLFCRLEQ